MSLFTLPIFMPSVFHFAIFMDSCFPLASVGLAFPNMYVFKLSVCSADIISRCSWDCPLSTLHLTGRPFLNLGILHLCCLKLSLLKRCLGVVHLLSGKFKPNRDAAHGPCYDYVCYCLPPGTDDCASAASILLGRRTDGSLLVDPKGGWVEMPAM
jgi:hypothetical protein